MKVYKFDSGYIAIYKGQYIFGFTRIDAITRLMRSFNWI